MYFICHMDYYKSSMKTQLQENEKALEVIKRDGPKSISEIADVLGVTTEGARFHLLKLQKEGLVKSESVAEGRGRPKQIWSLTPKGDDRFPDAHAELTANLITMMRETLGESAVDQVIAKHESAMIDRYSSEIDTKATLEKRISQLVEIRSREGYMAEYKKEGRDFVFIENHCPICSAAKVCQGFCRAELQTFKSLLGESVKISREEHILNDDRRCCYRISNS